MSRLASKEMPRNGDDYVRRLSKAAARRQLKRSAERATKMRKGDEANNKATSPEAAGKPY